MLGREEQLELEYEKQVRKFNLGSLNDLTVLVDTQSLVGSCDLERPVDGLGGYHGVLLISIACVEDCYACISFCYISLQLNVATSPKHFTVALNTSLFDCSL